MNARFRLSEIPVSMFLAHLQPSMRLGIGVTIKPFMNNSSPVSVEIKIRRVIVVVAAGAHSSAGRVGRGFHGLAKVSAIGLRYMPRARPVATLALITGQMASGRRRAPTRFVGEAGRVATYAIGIEDQVWPWIIDERFESVSML